MSMREKYRSMTFRRGEPPNHAKAVRHVIEFIQRNRPFIWPEPFEVQDPFVAWFPPAYIREKGIKWDFYGYDVGCVVGRFKEPFLIVEVGSTGDDSRHQPRNISQLIKDGIAKEYITRYHPQCRFIRINKNDVYYSEYLGELLFYR